MITPKNGARLLAGVVALVLSVTAHAQTEARLRGGIILSDGAPDSLVREIGHAFAGSELIAAAEIETAVARTQADLGTAEGRAAVARELQIDFLVFAVVTGSGRRTRTTLAIFDASGADVATKEGGAPTGRRAAAQMRALATELAEAGLPPIRERRAALATATPTTATPTETEPTPPVDQPPPEEGPSGPRPSPAVVRITAGIDLRTRDTAVNVTGETPRTYSSTFPEVSARVEVWPFANDAGAGAGFHGVFETSFAAWLKSRTARTGEEFSSSTFRLLGSLGYLIGVADNVLHIGALVGFGMDTFSIAQNTTLPSASYPYLRLAGAVRVAIAGNALYAQAEGAYRLTFGMGDLGPAFGTTNSASGYDINIGFGGDLGGFSYGARFAYESFALSFTGPGTLGPGTTGSDSAIRITAHLGWSIR